MKHEHHIAGGMTRDGHTCQFRLLIANPPDPACSTRLESMVAAGDRSGMIRTHRDSSGGPTISICISIPRSNNQLRHRLYWQRFAQAHLSTISGQMIHYTMSVLRALVHLDLCRSKQNCFVVSSKRGQKLIKAMIHHRLLRSPMLSSFLTIALRIDLSRHCEQLRSIPGDQRTAQF